MSEVKNRKRRRPRIITQTLFLDMLIDRRTRPIFIYVLIFVAISSAAFHWLEGWDWIDSFYFVVITFTTIGYGDFVPTMPITKLLTIFVGLNGIIILLMLFDVIRRVRQWELTEKATADIDETPNQAARIAD